MEELSSGCWVAVRGQEASALTEQGVSNPARVARQFELLESLFPKRHCLFWTLGAFVPAREVGQSGALTGVIISGTEMLVGSLEGGFGLGHVLALLPEGELIEEVTSQDRVGQFGGAGDQLVEARGEVGVCERFNLQERDLVAPPFRSLPQKRVQLRGATQGFMSWRPLLEVALGLANVVQSRGQLRQAVEQSVVIRGGLPTGERARPVFGLGELLRRLGFAFRTEQGRRLGRRGGAGSASRQQHKR
jgi:hypothetical protein